MLGIIERLRKRLADRGVGEGEIRQAIARLIHSPVAALIVGLTPNKADDAILEILREIIPAPA